MDQDTWKKNQWSKFVSRSKNQLAKSIDIVAGKETLADTIPKTSIF